jgi:branched-chain amino acid transport system substrate-binding protein
VVDEDETESVSKRKDKEAEPEAIVDFDAVFIPDSPKKAGLIIPPLAFYDVNDVYLLGTNIWNSEELIKMAGQYIQGDIIPDGFFDGSTSPHVKDFVKTFKETFNQVPEFMEAIAYDTATILFQLTNRSDNQSRRAYKDALRSLKDFPGLTGLTSFLDNGDVQKDLYLLRVRGDQLVEVKENGSSPD